MVFAAWLIIASIAKRPLARRDGGWTCDLVPSHNALSPMPAGKRSTASQGQPATGLPNRPITSLVAVPATLSSLLALGAL